MINIRFAGRYDLSDLVAIYNQAILDGGKTAHTTIFSVVQRLKWFEDHNNENFPIIVAEKNDNVIGYASISPYRSGREALRFTVEISFYVHKDFLGRGVGSMLLDYIIKTSPSKNIKNLLAIIINTNAVSIALVEKFGFKRWGELPDVADYAGKQVGHLYYGLRLKK